jgi:Asp-tRNA(Asn)/Glu-tRNA(Gln) amidotransferase A subunit family amidase
MANPTPEADLLQNACHQAQLWEPRIDAWVVRADSNTTVESETAEHDHDDARLSLTGVPFAVKDIINVAGFSTRFGSAAFEDAPLAQQDAPVVAALRAAGAIPLGKTRTTEFAFIDPTITRNPFDPRRTPGGSSSGSGAVVGAHVVPFALGTQTAGSLIRPACYCGAVAYKPGLGVLPTDGVSPLSHTFDQIGVIATSAVWLQAVFKVLQKSFSIGGSSASSVASDSDTGLRIAQIEVPEQTPDTEMAEAMAATRTRLIASGHKVDIRKTPVSFTELLSAHRTIMLYEAAQDLLAFVGDRRGQMRPKISAGLAEGEQISESSYKIALDQLARSQEVFWAELAPYDLLLAYPVSGAAPQDLTTTGDQSYLSPWTALGGPLLSFPAAIDSAGMPLGVMFAAAPAQDAKLMAQATNLERALGRITPPAL